MHQKTHWKHQKPTIITDYMSLKCFYSRLSWKSWWRPWTKTSDLCGNLKINSSKSIQIGFFMNISAHRDHCSCKNKVLTQCERPPPVTSGMKWSPLTGWFTWNNGHIVVDVCKRDAQSFALQQQIKLQPHG